MPHTEVLALLARFAELIDVGDWDAIGELFGNGSLSDPTGKPFARGGGEIASFFRTNTVLHDGSPRTKHLVFNTVVEEAGQGALFARSSYVVMQAAPDFPLQPIVTGRYHDEFERDAQGRLRFKNRRFFVDLEGDVSRHLKRPELAQRRQT
jgi:3-phenylpropionate/cinnamic acid dioxygenase small subunit